MKLHAFFLAFLCQLLLAVAHGGDAAPPVMLATVHEPGTDVTDYWVSEKLDGVRGRWTGEYLLSRGGQRIQAPDWFTADWPAVPMDGELWIARGRFEDVIGVVRDTEPDDAAWREVRFMVFDLPAHGGTFDARVRAMREIIDTAGIPWLRAIEQVRVANAAALDALLADVVARGGEGLMLHHRDAHYRPGRSSALRKYKPHDDAEARVVGHLPGKGKYEGVLGALLVERPDGTRFRIGTGFSDAERADPPPVGSWVTYRYNGVTEKGLPRFARFLRVREDMPPPDPR